MDQLKKFPRPFKTLSIPLKLMVLVDHYNNHEIKAKCINCRFMDAIINDFDKLKINNKEVEKSTMIPTEHLKYYMGNPSIKDEIERFMNGKSIVEYENLTNNNYT